MTADRVNAAWQILRDDEAAARVVLESGCRTDLSTLDRFVAKPVRRAREELADHFLSLGTLAPDLSAALTRSHSELVAMRCAQMAFENAGVRFRARFGFYAEALLAAQERFVRAAAQGAGDLAKPPRPPRRIALPRIEVDDEREILPDAACSFAEIDGWIAELEQRLRSALVEHVERAMRSLIGRGAVSLARTSIAVRRAAAIGRSQGGTVVAPASSKMRS